MNRPTVGAVLLASGFARRYGSNKLLDDYRGRPLFRYAFDALPPALFHRAVVTTQYPEILAAAEQAGYLALPNPHAGQGITAGLRLGLEAVSGLDGTLFAVCDQPNLNTESIVRLIRSFRESPDRIHALAWQGQRGNPVIFPKALYPELLALTGDTGGGAVVKRHRDLLDLTEAGSGAELVDIDEKERPR